MSTQIKNKLTEKIYEINSLNDNWDNYKAIKPLPKVIENIENLIKHIPDDLLKYIDIDNICPLPHGTIIIDFINNNNIISIEVGTTIISYFYIINGKEVCIDGIENENFNIIFKNIIDTIYQMIS